MSYRTDSITDSCYVSGRLESKLFAQGLITLQGGRTKFRLSHNKKRLGQKSKTFFWVQGPDLNRRPPGYEPDELPDCSTLRYLNLIAYNTIGAGDRNRTGTEFNLRRILSPVRLPVPPLRRTYRALI